MDTSELNHDRDEGGKVNKLQFLPCKFGPSADISDANINGYERDEANKQLIADHLTQFIAEKQAARSVRHRKAQSEAITESSSFFEDAMGDDMPR